jgi:hypothetical protein
VFLQYYHHLSTISQPYCDILYIKLVYRIHERRKAVMSYQQIPQGHPPQQPQGPQYAPPQQPMYQQPPQGPQYDPRFSQPMQQPMPPQAIRRPRRWPWIVALIVVFFIGMGVGSGIHGGDTTATTATNTTNTQSSGATTAPTQKPAPTARPLVWKTTHTFTGNGIKKTDVFTVANTWKLIWTCDPTSFSGDSYNVIVAVTNSDGTPSDPAAVNTLCKSGNSSGTTTEHQGGDVYLDVNSEAAWTLKIQEQK